MASSSRSRRLGASVVAGLLVVACAAADPPGPAAALPPDVLTFQYGADRTSGSLHETVLSPRSVTQTTFGKTTSFAVDGDVYAQPLYVSKLTIGGADHEVLFVATQHDSVYAFDATGATAKPLWHVALLGDAEIPVPAEDAESDDIAPEIGITGTPVIDRAAGLLYVVSKAKRADETYVQRLHALRLADGREAPGSPIAIAAQLPSTADDAVEGVLSFEALRHNQRAALALIGGRVWIAWASHGDNTPFHGWVLAYDTKDLTKPPAAWVTTPNGMAGGIWMSASGPSADADGNVYVNSGNGTFDEKVSSDDERTEFGSVALKLRLDGEQIKLVDWFAPHDEKDLNASDQDFGTTGAIILPDVPGPIPHRVLSASKSGVVYVLNRDAMGHYSSADRVVQTFIVGTAFFISNPVFFHNSLYVCPHKGTLLEFTMDPATGLFSEDAYFAPDCPDCYVRGSRPTISANGEADAIVWLIDNSAVDSAGPAILRAYDADDVQNLLYDSAATPNGRDVAAGAVKFTAPVVANGRVYVGGHGAITVYGLHPTKPQ